MDPVLPGVFTGHYEAWQLYQLSTMCRLNYSNSDAAWARLRQTMRVNWSRHQWTGSGGLVVPKTTLLKLPEYQIVIINGSTTLQDWKDNVKNVVMQTLAGQPSHGVGSDWWVKAENIWAGLVALGVGFNKPIVFTGHSLGGAIAACLLYKWKTQPATGQAVAVTFGAPRIATSQFHEFAGGTHLRCVNGIDAVASQPIAGWHFNPTLLGTGQRYQAYRHAGTMLWLNRSRPGILTAAGSDYSGYDYWRRLYHPGVSGHGIDPIQGAAEAATSHLIWAYVLRLRKECHNVDRFSLWGFDDVNNILNGVFNEDWPDISILVDGHGKETEVLNNDPPVPIPPPPAETAPLDVYERVIRRGPGNQPVPPTPREQDIRVLRRRRNFG